MSASADGTVRVWDLHRTDVPVLSTSRARVRFELEDGRIVTGAEDGTVRVSSSDGTLLRVWDTGAAQFGVFVAEFVADDAPIARDPRPFLVLLARHQRARHRARRPPSRPHVITSLAIGARRSRAPSRPPDAAMAGVLRALLCDPTPPSPAHGASV